MRAVELYELGNGGRVEIHPAQRTGYFVFKDGKLVKDESVSRDAVEAFFAQLRDAGTRVKWIGDRPCEAKRASAPRRPQVNFHGAPVISSIHALGLECFSIDQVIAALSEAGIEVSRGTVRSHIGCAVRGPKRGLSRSTNEHRKKLAPLPKPLLRKLKRSL